MTALANAVARRARREDAAAIARIYNQGTEDCIATFETAPRTTADIQRLLDECPGRYPRRVIVVPARPVSSGTHARRARRSPACELVS